MARPMERLVLLLRINRLELGEAIDAKRLSVDAGNSGLPVTLATDSGVHRITSRRPSIPRPCPCLVGLKQDRRQLPALRMARNLATGYLDYNVRAMQVRRGTSKQPDSAAPE